MTIESIGNTEIIRTLAKAGFYAVQCNRTREAKQIFQFIAKARPNEDVSVIGLAMVAMTDNRLNEGEALLADAGQRTNSEEIQAFHVFALMLVGKISQAQALHASLLQTAKDSTVIQFMQALSKELTLRTGPLHHGWSHHNDQIFKK